MGWPCGGQRLRREPRGGQRGAQERERESADWLSPVEPSRRRRVDGNEEALRRGLPRSSLSLPRRSSRTLSGRLRSRCAVSLHGHGNDSKARMRNLGERERRTMGQAGEQPVRRDGHLGGLATGARVAASSLSSAVDLPKYASSAPARSRRSSLELVTCCDDRLLCLASLSRSPVRLLSLGPCALALMWNSTHGLPVTRVLNCRSGAAREGGLAWSLPSPLPRESSLAKILPILH